MEYNVFSESGGRPVNEDYAEYLEVENMNIFILGDGLGGHGGGEIASRTAAETVRNVFLQSNDERVEDTLKSAFSRAHETLQAMQDAEYDRNRYKTTLVVLVIYEDKFIWGHMGDSRIYHFNKNVLIERSKDHSVPQMLVNAGEIKEKKIRFHEDRNKLLRVLGDGHENARPYISEEKALSDGDAFLLCTDGFWELINEKNMIRGLKRTDDCFQWLGFMKSIVEKNRRKQEKDNYTAIAVKL